MTDETEQGKPKTVSDVALVYSKLPAFHLEFLDGLLTIEQIERGLSDSSKLNEDRLLQHNRVVDRRLGLRLSIQEVNALVFPFRYESCFSVREVVEPDWFLNNPERVIVVDVVELIRQGYLTGDHLAASELDHGLAIKDVSKKYQRAVVNLLELEKTNYRLRRPVSKSIVKVWRQYIDLHDAELKQGALLSGINSSGHVDTPDGLSIPWLLVEAKRTRRVSGQAIEAAYRLFRKRNGRNHKTPDELFELLTPEDLPEFVKWRNDQKILKAIRLMLVDGVKWDYQNFLVRHGKLVKLLKNKK